MMTITKRALVRVAGAGLLALGAALPVLSQAQMPPAFHFESICRSDPAAGKNTVTVVLHGADQLDATGAWVQSHAPLAGATISVMWTYVDYRQNHAVFKYQQDVCTTARDGSCTFHGGSKRARWQLADVAGYTLSAPAFDTEPTDACPNVTMIDFW